MMHMDDAACGVLDFLQDGLVTAICPRPGIAKPESRQDMQGRRFRSTIADADFNQDIFGVRFGVFDEETFAL